MKIGLYAVFDTASGVYDGPIPMQSDAVALRNFRGVVQNAEHPIAQNPEDFSLIRIGEWNDATGEVVNHTNVTLITGLEVVAEMRNVVPINDDVNLEDIVDA